MYGQEPPTRLKIRDLVLLEACPASGGSQTQMPKPQLERWVAVADAVGEWYRSDLGTENVNEIEERQMGWLDPVQRDIASSLFATYRQIMPKAAGDTVEFDSSFSEVWDTEANTTIGAASQLSIVSGNTTERVKIKTGKSRVSPEEKAVLVEGSDDPDVAFIEVNVSAGEIDDITMEMEERTELISRLFSIPDSVKGRKGTVPGLHCYGCARPARCGQYPALDTRLIGAESRAVLVSKKWLARLSQCERQVAWARLYGIPTDASDEEPKGPAALGISFHRGAAAALVSDDPDRTFKDYAMAATPADQADLLQLWDNLRRLDRGEDHPVEYLETEYGVGVTGHSPGPFVDSRDRFFADRLIAVVLAGFADATGKEADGTPAVVEFRTGGSGSLPLEPELYALGAHLLSGKTPVAVHTHRIGDPNELTCDRRLFDEPQLAEAREALGEAIATIASWHPHDALAPDYTVGDWCSWCEFSSRCVEFRGNRSVPDPQSTTRTGRPLPER